MMAIIVIAMIALEAIVLVIFTNLELNYTPTIELVQGKINDENCNDEIQDAVKYLKVVNK